MLSFGDLIFLFEHYFNKSIFYQQFSHWLILSILLNLIIVKHVIKRSYYSQKVQALRGSMIVCYTHIEQLYQPLLISVSGFQNSNILYQTIDYKYFSFIYILCVLRKRKNNNFIRWLSQWKTLNSPNVNSPPHLNDSI